MKNFSSNDPSKQDEPSITLQREEVTQVQARDVTRGTRPKGKWREIMTFFFSPTTIPWLHHSVDCWGCTLDCICCWFFLSMITFFQNIWKLIWPVYGCTAVIPWKKQNGDWFKKLTRRSTLRWVGLLTKVYSWLKTALLVVVRITYPWPVGKNHKDTTVRYWFISEDFWWCLCVFASLPRRRF